MLSKAVAPERRSYKKQRHELCGVVPIAEATEGRYRWRLRLGSIVAMSTIRRAAQPGHAALRGGRASHQCHVYHVTTSTKGRAPVFNNFDAASVAARCFGNQILLGDAILMAWVLMPDHVHWLLQLGDRDPLAAVINRLKAASARSVNIELGRAGALWSRAYHDHALRSDEGVRAVARYIIANPIRAGLARRVGDYPFWNAIWL